MLHKIIGWFLLLSGILFLIKPAILKNKLQKKTYKKFLYFIIGATFALGGYMASFAFRFKGALPKVIAVIGIIALIRGFMFLNSKTRQKLASVFSKAPLKIYRIFAAGYALLGVLMIWGVK